MSTQLECHEDPNSHKGLLPLIHRLPLELLSEIFTHVCDKILLTEGRVSCPVLVLAAVCGAWRGLAFSMSQLWTNLHVDVTIFLSLPIATLRRFGTVVNLALEHSRSSPLDILLSDGDFEFANSMSERVNVVESIMTAVARHSHRWRHVSLTLSHVVLSRMNPFVRDFPFLESISVLGGDIPPFDMVNTAPKLRCLNFHFYNEPDATAFRLPWDQISTMWLSTGRSIPLSSVLSLVELCPGLQRLEVATLGFDHDEPRISPIHSNIESLILPDLYHYTSIDLERLLDSLTLPQLTHLTLGYEAVPEPASNWIWTGAHERAFERLLMRSGCRILSLTLRQVPIMDDELACLFRLLPFIERLSYEQGYFDLDIFGITNRLLDFIGASNVLSTGASHLEYFQPVPLLLPKLKKLELTLMYMCGTPSHEAIVEFVKSRWIPNSTATRACASQLGVQAECIKSVAVSYYVSCELWKSMTSQEFEALFPLMCLREEGLEFAAEVVCDEFDVEVCRTIDCFKKKLWCL